MAVDGSEQQQQPPVLTSTTAPGKIFGSRAELAQHYKSQWHKYNLKRREAGLPPLLESDFEARLAAAQEALESSQKKNNSRRDAHLKKKNKNKQKQDKKNKRGQQQQTLEGQEEDNDGGVTRSSQALAYEQIKQEREQQQEKREQQQQEEEGNEETEKNKEGENTTILGQQTDEPAEVPAATTTPPEVVEIDPRRCLFDGHLSKSVQDNVARMQRKYGFFIPDAEYLVDLPGLIGYCHEKISIGRICLYCQKGFSSARACQQHMVSKRHTKLRYEAGIDLHEFAVFYDFDEANREFLWSSNNNNKKNVDNSGEEEKEDAEEKKNETKDNGEDEDDDEDDEWEDVSDDDDEEEAKNDYEDRDDMEDEDEEDVYAGYEEEVAAMGLDVTPLGELVFPDGRIIGHRAFRRYYRQRAPRRPDERTSVLAARQAAGDRLYQGRVVNVLTDDNNNNNTTLAMARASGAGLPPTPGGGKGLLVAAAASGGVADGQQQQQQQPHAFTQLSIYRYRAAMKKQRRDNAKAQRVQYRSTMNINRMDKKHNRLMNGVSVAHAAR